MPNFSSFVRFFIKLVLGLSAAAIAVALLMFAAFAFGLHWLIGLVTGRKPTSRMVFSRFQQFPSGMRSTTPPNRADAIAAAGQIVDVEAREVQADPHRP